MTLAHINEARRNDVRSLQRTDFRQEMQAQVAAMLDRAALKDELVAAIMHANPKLTRSAARSEAERALCYAEKGLTHGWEAQLKEVLA